MTTKERLIWRLANRPTVNEINDLITSEVISKDEARGILFSSETEEDRDKKSLEAEIKFLRQLVENLSENRTKIVETIRNVYVPYQKYEWYKPYQVWCGVDDKSYTKNTDFQMSALSGTQQNLVGSLTASVANTANFASIKTF